MTSSQRGRAPGHLRDHELERFLLNELPAARQAEVASAALTDAALAQRLATLRQDNAEILSRYPALAHPSAPRVARRRFWLPASFVLATAAAALVVAVVQNPEETRSKGETTRLVLHSKRASDLRSLRPLDRVRPHDRIAITYYALESQFGAVFSVDSRASVSRHFPDAESAARLQRQQTLDHSFELDETPGVEQFVFATAAQPFVVGDVERRVVDLVRQGRVIPPNIDAVSLVVVTLQKETP